jgi:hypothetical protein
MSGKFKAVVTYQSRLGGVSINNKIFAIDFIEENRKYVQAMLNSYFLFQRL